MLKLLRYIKKYLSYTNSASFYGVNCYFLCICICITLALADNAHSFSNNEMADLARKKVKELIKKNQLNEYNNQNTKNNIKNDTNIINNNLPFYGELEEKVKKSASKNRHKEKEKKVVIKKKPIIPPIIKPDLISFKELATKVNQRKTPAKKTTVALTTKPSDLSNKNIIKKASHTKLSSETIATLNILPDDLTGGKYKTSTSNKKSKVAIKRLSHNNTHSPDEWKTHETLGVSIKVRQQKMDIEKELDQAYKYIESNSPKQAFLIYQNILKQNPNEPLALFGLATTYHRLGDIDEARLTYGKILRNTPNNIEALNNFLVLVGEESPKDALDIMERLVIKNPDFSPLHAQISLLYQKLGDNHSSIEAMRDASSLEPENMLYKYNLAILYDQNGYKPEAMKTYRNLIENRYKGKKIPAEVEDIQERLTFLASN